METLPNEGIGLPSLVSTSLLVVSIVFPIIATAAVILRYYCRRIKHQSLQADDWVILLALIAGWGQSINIFAAAAKAGVGTTTVPLPQAVKAFTICLWVVGFPLNVSLASIKISILLFYKRIFIIKPFEICVQIAIAILTAWGVSSCIAQLLVGDPINSMWRSQGPKLRYNYPAYDRAYAIMSLIFDVLVLCFPLPVIRSLKMSTKRKITVSGIFWLGGFCCIAAALRIYFLVISGYHKRLPVPEDASQSVVWAQIEPNTSVLAACLPTYAPLFTNGTPTFISKLRSRIVSLMSGSRSIHTERGEPGFSSSKESIAVFREGSRNCESERGEDDEVELVTQGRVRPGIV